MLMADTLAIFLIVLGFLFALPGLWLLVRALWPGVVARAAGRCRDRPLTSFGVGLMVTALAVFGVIVSGNALGGVGQMAAIALLCLFLVLAHTGVSGFAQHVGERLPSPIDRDRPWRATIRGGVALELTYLLPVLGWFVILPITWIVGAGAATLSIVSRRTSGAPKAAFGEHEAVADEVVPPEEEPFRPAEATGR